LPEIPKQSEITLGMVGLMHLFQAHHEELEIELILELPGKTYSKQLTTAV